MNSYHAENNANIKITPEFHEALELLKSPRKCVFITGKAGTGKSTLLNIYRKQCKNDPVVLAPTGVAALNVDGKTIHSFFKFGTDVTPDSIKRSYAFIQRKRRKLYNNLEMIFIDEVSMLRADLLDCIDQFLRLHGPLKGKPFGGIRLRFFGDLYQLPPVVVDREKEIFSPGSLYESEFFFDAHVMRAARNSTAAPYKLNIFHLTHIYRQSDDTFRELINRIRNNTVTEADIDIFNTRLVPDTEIPDRKFFVVLTGTNNQANSINSRKLGELGKSTEIFTSSALITGDCEKNLPRAPLELKYCIGSQIMMLTNDPAHRWVNGSLGHIKNIRPDDEEISINLMNGSSIIVDPYTWTVNEYALSNNTIISEPKGTYTQFPFQLCWAVTIHKSQGKTFNHMGIMLNRAFAPGQVYVALSRCRTLSGIDLYKPLQRNLITTDQRVIDFFTNEFQN